MNRLSCVRYFGLGVEITAATFSGMSTALVLVVDKRISALNNSILNNVTMPILVSQIKKNSDLAAYSKICLCTSFFVIPFALCSYYMRFFVKIREQNQLLDDGRRVREEMEFELKRATSEAIAITVGVAFAVTMVAISRLDAHDISYTPDDMPAEIWK